ncbi:MAG: Hsp33 family molecular chaperone HslO [Halioglobus sp.]
MKQTPDNPEPQQQSTSEDRSLRFLFEEADIRGETVHLDNAYQEVVAIHQYAPGVSRLLGEFLAAAVLLSTTLKFQGKLILQVRSEGQIPLLMVECDNALQVRAIARGAQQATSNDNALLLTNGQLAITIDPSNGQRYQGIVPLVDGSLALSLDAYFEQSEQLKTRFWLAANGTQAAGLLLQQLPMQTTADQEMRLQQWDHVCTLAATVQSTELLELKAEQLLHRLYHEEPLRVFPPAAVSFRCSCSRARTRNALASLQAAEVEELLQELGSITMDCEFCNQQYRFTREDLVDILGGSETSRLH